MEKEPKVDSVHNLQEKDLFNIEKEFNHALNFFEAHIEFLKNHRKQTGLSDKNSIAILDYYEAVSNDKLKLTPQIEERIKNIQNQLGCKIGEFINFDGYFERYDFL